MSRLFITLYGIIIGSPSAYYLCARYNIASLGRLLVHSVATAWTLYITSIVSYIKMKQLYLNIVTMKGTMVSEERLNFGNLPLNNLFYRASTV